MVWVRRLLKHHIVQTSCHGQRHLLLHDIGKIPSSHLLPTLLWMQNTFDLLDCNHTLPSHVHLFIHQHPKVLLSRAALCPFFAQPIFGPRPPEILWIPVWREVVAAVTPACHTYASSSTLGPDAGSGRVLAPPWDFPTSGTPFPEHHDPPFHCGTHLLQN